MTYKKLIRLSTISLLIALGLFASARLSLEFSPAYKEESWDVMAKRLKFNGSNASNQKYFKETVEVDLTNTEEFVVESISTEITVTMSDSPKTRLYFEGVSKGFKDEAGIERPWIRHSKNRTERFEFDQNSDWGINVDFNSHPKVQLIRIELGRDAKNFLKLQTVSGDIKLESIRCRKLAVNSTSGDISASGKAEMASFQSTSGEILSSFEAPELVFETTSGDQNLSLISRPKMVQIESVSGDLHIQTKIRPLPLIAFESTSGELSNESGWPTTAKDPKALIQARTVSGNLELKGQLTVNL